MTATQPSLFTAAADRRLGGRLAAGALAAVVISVPFTLLALMVLARFEPLEVADRRIAIALNAAVLPRPGLTRTFEVLALVTHPNVMRAIAVVIAVVLWRQGRHRLVAWLVVTMAVGGLLSPLLKGIVARARPTFDDPVSGASGYSFPSGHALNSMLLAACLVVLAHPLARRRARAGVRGAALAIVVVTGVDRIALGVHFVSDVLAGWLVAIATVCITTAAFAGERGGLERGLGPDRDRASPAGQRVSAPARSWVTVLGRLVAGLAVRWVLVLAVLVATGAVLTRIAERVWPFTVEDGLSQSLAAGRTPFGDHATALMSNLGDTSTIVGFGVIAVVVLRLLLHRWRESLLVAVVTLAQSLVFLTTTALIDRPRPAVDHLDLSPPTSSFPSGHTSAAIALYSSLALVVHRRVGNPWSRRALLAVLLSLPAMVAIARLYRGMHHPSDIVASGLNAGLLLLLTDRLLRATPLPDDGPLPVSGVAVRADDASEHRSREAVS